MFLNKINRIFKAVLYSISGIRFALNDEAAFREICCVVVVGIPLGIYLSDNFCEAVILIFPFFICIIVELINTAIENICDMISTENHILIKKAKDLGSAAQFISQIILLIVWLGYFLKLK